ncbi:hypothetical protein [Legionella cardiaca]|uniref:non-homologous end-joining DNA ligase LigD n=1 Tax=Legionella cardiaca TaxID=1071983 RepID=UPI003084082E
MVDAAFEVRKYFNELNLVSFIKTTSGKGLQVIVPIKPQHGWIAIKQFTRSLLKR